jgi:hypothetical protein
VPRGATDQAGCEEVRYRPSRRRPRYVVADIAPATFLGEPYDAESARLEVRFRYPAGVAQEYYRINWVEPERNLMLGFHQDADYQGLGPCHIQLDYDGTTVDRYGATFLDEHPLAVLDERLQQFATALAAIRWEAGSPSLPTWPV